MNYFKECALAIDLLEREAAGGDPERAAQIAHQLLGASSTLGMLRLAAAFATVEEAAAVHQVPAQERIVAMRGLLILSMAAIHEVDFGGAAGGC